MPSAYNVLIHIVETRFPELTTLAQQQAAQINKPELLSATLNKLFTAQTAEHAQQILIESNDPTDTRS
jgi:hypothetical protein